MVYQKIKKLSYNGKQINKDQKFLCFYLMLIMKFEFVEFQEKEVKKDKGVLYNS